MKKYCTHCNQIHYLLHDCEGQACDGCCQPLSHYELQNYYTTEYTEVFDCHFQQFCKRCYFALLTCQSKVTRAALIVKPDSPDDVINEFY